MIGDAKPETIFYHLQTHAATDTGKSKINFHTSDESLTDFSCDSIPIN